MWRRKSTSIQYINKLRIIAVFAVVAAHIATWMATIARPLSFDWWLCKWVHLCGLWSVPVFVMISGALLLDDAGTETPGAFYRKRLQRIGIPLVFWTIVYLIARKVLGHEQLMPRRIIELIVTLDVYYHLWFLYVIVGLYLLTPLLRRCIRRTTTRQRVVVIVVILVLSTTYSVINKLFWGNPRFILTSFVSYIAYYLCGYQLRLIDPKRVSSIYFVPAVAISILYVVLLTGPFVQTLGEAEIGFFYDSFSPPVIVVSIAIFWCAYLTDRRKRPLQGTAKTAVQWLASTTLGIYVLHPLVLEFMRYKFADEAAESSIMVGLVVGTVFAFVVCYLITSALMRIPLLRRVVC